MTAEQDLKINPNVTPREMSALHRKAHKLGLKSLYYHESKNPAQVLARENADCVACEA